MVVVWTLHIALDLLFQLPTDSLRIIIRLTTIIVVLTPIKALPTANGATFIFSRPLSCINQAPNLFLLLSLK